MDLPRQIDGWFFANCFACYVVAGVMSAETPTRYGSITCRGGDAPKSAAAVAVDAASVMLSTGLLLDFDARYGVETDDQGRVLSWKNAVANSPIAVLKAQPLGREVGESGRPTLGSLSRPAQTGNSVVAAPSVWLHFAQQELVSADEDALDGLVCGQGCTWFALLSVQKQRVGVPDVNAFWGTLKNGSLYEGLWAGVTDQNELWWGPRNGLSFGRVDANNPWLRGPKLTEEHWHVAAGRLAAGTGEVKVELFLNTAEPVAVTQWLVNPQANASKFAIGQERDAVQHPGKESFDGDIARFLLFGRPLSDVELRAAMSMLVRGVEKK